MNSVQPISTDATKTDTPVGVADQLTGFWKYTFQAPAIGLGLFALWSAGPGIAEDHIHLSAFTLVIWVLALLVLPMRKGADWRVGGAAGVDVGGWLRGVGRLVCISARFRR